MNLILLNLGSWAKKSPGIIILSEVFYFILLVNFVSLSTAYPFQFVSLIKKKKSEIEVPRRNKPHWFWASATIVLLFSSVRDAWIHCKDVCQFHPDVSEAEQPLREMVLFTVCLSGSHKGLDHMEASAHTLPVLGRTRQPHFSVSSTSLLTQRKL